MHKTATYYESIYELNIIVSFVHLTSGHMKIRLNLQLEVYNEEQIFNLLKELLPNCDIGIVVRLKDKKIKEVRAKVVRFEKIKKLGQESSNQKNK